MKRRLKATAVGLVSVMTLATACSTEPAGSASGPGASTVNGQVGSAATELSKPPSDPGDATTSPPAGSSEDARLVVDATALILQNNTGDEVVAFLSGNIPESEVEECMHDAGFEYVPEQTPEELVAADVRYSMDPDDYAATYGLGIVAQELQLLPPIEELRNLETTRSMTDAERDAYNMTLGHCQGGFDPDRRARSDALNIALEQFRPVLAADDAVAAALAAWQQCMGSAGFEFEDPMQMRQTFYTRAFSQNRSETLEEIFDDELRVAQANVSCEADYDAIRRQTLRDRFEEFKTLFETALASGATLEAQG